MLESQKIISENKEEIVQKKETESLVPTENISEKLFTLSPELQKDYTEKEPRIKIIDMKEFVGKTRSEVADLMSQKYGQDYYVPGVEYQNYFLANPDKIPKEMKDYKWYYFIGSSLREQNSPWDVPCVIWDGKGFEKDIFYIPDVLDEPINVVLFEKWKPVSTKELSKEDQIRESLHSKYQNN